MVQLLVTILKILLWLYVIAVCGLLIAPRAVPPAALLPLVHWLALTGSTPAGFISLVALPLLIFTWWELINWQQLLARR